MRYACSETQNFVHNQLTGLEIGIERGANVLELDLNKTRDGHIITAHGIPFFKVLHQTKQEYLHQYPEALTLMELVEWLHHIPDLKIYLELKTAISIAEIKNSIDSYVSALHNADKQTTTADLYDRVMIYTNSKKHLCSLLKEKSNQDLSTNELKLFIVLNRPLTESIIDGLSDIGVENCRLRGVEQGAFIIAHPTILHLLTLPFAIVPPLKYIAEYYSRLRNLVKYVHDKNLLFIFGTVDDLRWIRKIMDTGVDGMVLNDPKLFEEFGVEMYKEITSRYTPFSLNQRVSNI